MTTSRLTALAVAAIAVAALLIGASAAGADWTTYHGDAARSGVDSSSTGSAPFAPAWTSEILGGDVYAEPLIYKGLGLVEDIKRDLAATLLRTDHESLSEIVGADAAAITAEDWPL